MAKDFYFKVGDTVKFTAWTEFGEMEKTGIIQGYAECAKKLWGDEVAGYNDDEEIYVVKTVDNYGNSHHHLALPDNIDRKIVD